MKGLSKEELLGYLEGWYCMSTPKCEEIEKQAYKQIRQLIEVCYECDYFQKNMELYKPEVDESELREKINTAIENFNLAVDKVFEQIKSLLQEAGVKVKEDAD